MTILVARFRDCAIPEGWGGARRDSGGRMRKAVEHDTLQAFVETGAVRDFRCCGVLTCGDGNQSADGEL